MDLLLGGAHVLDLRGLQRDILLEIGDPLRDLARKVHVAFLDRDAGRCLILRGLGAIALDLGFENAAAGDQPRKIVARLALRLVGIADFLVEDTQRVRVDDRRTRFVRAGTTEGEKLAPDGHASLSVCI